MNGKNSRKASTKQYLQRKLHTYKGGRSVRVQLLGSESALRGIEQLKFLHIAVRKLKRRIYRHVS